jgi:hypothetical protein
LEVISETKEGIFTPWTSLEGQDLLEPDDSISQVNSTESTEDDVSVEHLSPADSEEIEEANNLLNFQNVKGCRNRYRITYTDPWKLFATMELCRRNGLPQPKVKVWGGDGYRIQDPLPVSLFGSRWSGGKRKTRFAELKEHQIQMYVLLYKTHWGNFLRVSSAEKSKCEHRLFCTRLRDKISAFLNGLPHPDWTPAHVEEIFGPGKYIPRKRKMRSNRLIETLKTADGIFLSRYLSTPNEMWTWEKFDMYTLWNIDHLLDGEFYDGKLSINPEQVTTSYDHLKQMRKRFKAEAHEGARNLKSKVSELNEHAAPWLRHFNPIWKECARYSEHQYTLRVGLLCQTRGCGTPPPIVIIKSKLKFLLGCSEKPAPLSITQKKLIQLAVEDAISKLPAKSMTGLATKSRITVTSSACLEDTRKDGGTAEAIRELVATGTTGTPVEIRDLDTGKVTHRETLSNMTPGEYIFWKSLEYVIRLTDEERRTAFLTVVKEPGKARSVTKTRACVKVVLDLVSKLCAEPLQKGVESSTSGMSQANHGWNLFQSYMGSETGIGMFDVLTRETTRSVEGVGRTDVYRDVFVSSTDYGEATDHMHHEVARILGIQWMRACGIPVVLRKLVASICYNERKILFRADGYLNKIGYETSDKEVRCVTLRKGILMGDPLTKPVLHLINVCTRILGEKMFDINFLSKGFTDPAGVRDALLLESNSRS